MTDEQKHKYRKQFIDDFANSAVAQRSGADVVERAYIRLIISKCMDAAIQHRGKLDLNVDDGYELVLKGENHV